MATGSGAKSKQMKLSAFISGSGSYHIAGWRHPDSYNDCGTNFERWIEHARKLEAAKFDMMFVADQISPTDYAKPEIFERSPWPDRFEPMTMLAALVAHTKCLGLAATLITSYKPPYDVAREIASLDLISGGRAGWNVVTGIAPEDAAQYSDSGFMAPSERYARGEEFVDVVTALWESVKPGAYLRNRETGVYTDLSKIHTIDHKGKYFAVKGPLSVGPSPQGRPVLIQAGQSEEGRQLAARIAEVIFTAQSDFELAKQFYDDIKTRAAGFGRNPDHVKILPGCLIIVGKTAQEADEKEEFLNSLIDVKPALARLKMSLANTDLDKYPLDELFPELPPGATVSRGTNHVLNARKNNLTLRQVLVRASVSNAHFMVKGTPSQVVDQMEHWFKNGACDGFNVLTSVMPTAFDETVEMVLPELRRRGLFRTEYEGKTLRENLGIPADPIPRQKAS